mmetsp:Transcript_1089/g.2211  ORF Transcript_1089/g.2211 Transcript_1089/m.2211 type:complete len:90 (-) Transcript_1089:20-289(-)
MSRAAIPSTGTLGEKQGTCHRTGSSTQQLSDRFRQAFQACQAAHGATPCNSLVVTQCLDPDFPAAGGAEAECGTPECNFMRSSGQIIAM